MLKVVLQNSGADLVFSGATGEAQQMLPSHDVIADDDPVFSRCAANFHVAFVPFYFGLVSSRCVGYASDLLV